REEERRRLRRDLHDGIGATLASLAHRLDLAGDLVRTEPDAAMTMLAELKGQVKGTVAEIRRVVYALRPPALDDFGLVPAIREHVARQTEGSGLQVHIESNIFTKLQVTDRAQAIVRAREAGLAGEARVQCEP
ncbi:MAG: hypothetical protein DLM70_11750, partial [Chloroflexi bacterium]